MSTRVVVLLSALVVIVAIGASVFYFLTLQWRIAADEEWLRQYEAEVSARRVQILNLVSDATSIDQQDLLRGFWYTYTDENGDDSVFVFDADDLAQRNLSDADLAQMVSVLQQSNITGREAMSIVEVQDMPKELQFHNSLYAFQPDDSFLRTRDALMQRLAAGDYISEDLFRLAYLYELEGKYEERDMINARNCSEFGERCSGGLSLAIEGTVVDISGNAVPGAAVSVLSKPSVDPVMTNENGEYTIEVSARELEKVRLGASKRNFSDGVTSVVILTEGRNVYQAPDIVVSSPLNVVTLDTEKGTVSGVGNRVLPDGTVVIKTNRSEYRIPDGAIVHANGTRYDGMVDVYLYEFTQNTVPTGLMQVDTFDEVRGYAGDLMKSFGMPYIQFFSPDREQLHVLKSNPMVLIYQIANMEELYNDTLQIYGPLTPEDMEFLVESSVGQPYRIDRDFLIANKLLRFPAFWAYDQRAGVWENTGISVLDVDGTIQSRFYTMSDRSR